MKVTELRDYIRDKGKSPKGSKKAPLLAMALEILKEEKKPHVTSLYMNAFTTLWFCGLFARVQKITT